jgi:hypothetical protein
MNQTTQFAVHYFDNLEDMSFCPKDYSFLKFGSDKVAKKFGYELAEAFFQEHKSRLVAEQFVVIPSPYNYVKNAATIMSEHFVDRLNHLVVSAGGLHVEWSTINRKMSYIKDYGFLSADERKKLIDGDTFHVNKGYLEGKNLIFIDDVNITGTHERKLEEILDESQVFNDRFFLYYGKFVDSGKAGADIESKINFAGIQDLEDFVKLTKEPNHQIIVRPIKFLLSRTPNKFEQFVDLVDEEFLCKLYYGAIAEGYYNIPDYRLNLNYLNWYIQKEENK